MMMIYDYIDDNDDYDDENKNSINDDDGYNNDF